MTNAIFKTVKDHRRVAAIGVGVVQFLLILTFVRHSTDGIVVVAADCFHLLRGDSKPFENLESQSADFIVRLTIVVVAVGLQLAYVASALLGEKYTKSHWHLLAKVLFAFPASQLVIGLVFSGLEFCKWFTPCADFLNDHHPIAWWVGATVAIGLAIIAIGLAIRAIGKKKKWEKKAVAWRATMLLLLVSASGFTASLAINIAIEPWEHTPVDGSRWGILTSLPVLIWSAGAVVAMLFFSVEGPEDESVPKTSEEPAKYISETRTAAIALLTLTFIAANIAIYHSRRSRDLVDARVYAVEVWQHASYPKIPEPNWKGRSPFDPNADAELKKAGSLVRFKTEAWGVFWKTANPNAFARLRELADKLRLEWKADWNKYDRPQGPLEYTALADLLEQITSRLNHKEIKVPGLDTELPTSAAIYLVTPLIFALLVMIRYGTEKIIAARDRLAGEPWLILEGWSWSDQIVTCVWLSFIAASGWIAGGALLLTRAETIRATQTDAPLRVCVEFLFSFALIFGSGWVGIGAANNLLKLRGIRLARAEGVAAD